MCKFQFVKIFSSIAGTLAKLMRKGGKYDWIEGCDIAFEKLK